MRIAITADPMLPVPPRQYGGTERLVYMLVRGLVDRGHDVTLFAHEASDVPCRLVKYRGKSSDHPIDIVRNTVSVSRLVARRPDVVHSFGRMAYMALLLPVKIPKIMTYERLPTLRQIRRAVALARNSTLTFTGCSAHIARRIAPYAGVSVVHNGVPTDAYSPNYIVPSDAPLVFLGRLERIKGVHTAIQVAKAAGRQLVIAGNVVDSDEGRRYFTTQVLPSLDSRDVRYVGPVDDSQKNALLRSAAALLMPIEWEEPFGIVMAEALACGTPIIGFARGSVPEIVRHGTTGLLCADVTEMTDAVFRIPALDRRACRTDCVERFSAEVMVDAYERLYRSHIAACRVRSL